MDNEQLNEQLKDIVNRAVDARLEELDVLTGRHYTLINGRFARLEQKAKRFKQVVGLLDTDPAMDVVDRHQKRLSEVSDRIQLLLLKITVLTELSRLRPDLLTRIVVDVDRSDRWWKQGAKLTLGQWAKRFDDLYPTNMIPGDMV